jgi:hypothetical protein
MYLSEYPRLDRVKKEIEGEVNGYVDAITLFSSLREYFQDKNIECQIEPKIKKKSGGYKTPDLLVKSDNFVIIDHKFTSSTDKENLMSKIDEMETYNKIFLFVDSGLEKEVQPEVIMLTPEKATALFNSLLNCPITWGYVIEEQVEVKQSVRSVRDKNLLSCFNPSLLCSRSGELAKYKFILSHPPIPYTSCHVFTILWNLMQPTQLLTKEFDVKYSDILGIFNTFFPPWLRPEIKQMTITRLDEALTFLQDIGWIKWLQTDGLIIVDKSKGRMISDVFSYFMDKFVEMEHQKKVHEYEKKLKKSIEKKKGTSQKEISSYFP